MAIIGSYPLASPSLVDTIIGNKYYEGEGLLTKSFNIQDIAELIDGQASTLQSVSDNGNTINMSSSDMEAIRIDVSSSPSVGQKGIKVYMPSQTISSFASPDCYVAYINGQNPGSLPNYVSGFYSVVQSGADNISFVSEHSSTTTDSLHFKGANSLGCISDFMHYTSNSVYLYKVDYLGNTTANSFIKTGGLSSEFLKADGSSDSSAFRKIIVRTSTYNSSGGTTALTLVGSVLMPANSFVPGDWINLKTYIAKSGTNSSLSLYVYMNTSNTLTGATSIGKFTSTNDFVAGQFSREWFLDGGYIRGYYFETASSLTGTEPVTSTGLPSSASFYPSTPYYILIAVQMGSLSDTYFYRGVNITN
jgi:hypothetical protein